MLFLISVLKHLDSHWAFHVDAFVHLSKVILKRLQTILSVGGGGYPLPFNHCPRSGRRMLTEPAPDLDSPDREPGAAADAPSHPLHSTRQDRVPGFVPTTAGRAVALMANRDGLALTLPTANTS